jgi:hypothetical protein
MTKSSLVRSELKVSSSTLLARLIDSPHLVQTVRALEPSVFAALVRRVGVEDAGEIVAVATTEQLVAAFDEDLFRNERPGERETFDREKFVRWLEVILEGGDALAAKRIVELSFDFVVQALSSIVLVIDHDALSEQMGQGGDDADTVDKAIESALSEEIDGYLLVSKHHAGWDAALALILALDRDDRAFLVQVLDRCADMNSRYLDELEELAGVLNAADSLAEDVEAEREERRSARGFVEPRAARSFLAFAKMPPSEEEPLTRDAVTRAYFRNLSSEAIPFRTNSEEESAKLLLAITDAVSTPAMPISSESSNESTPENRLILAMRRLHERDADVWAKRMEELAYLANVVWSGAHHERNRFERIEAAEAAIATVGLGAELDVLEGARRKKRPSADELCDVLLRCPADLLFRKASSTLTSHKLGRAGLLRHSNEIARVISELQTTRNRQTTRPVV